MDGQWILTLPTLYPHNTHTHTHTHTRTHAQKHTAQYSPPLRTVSSLTRIPVDRTPPLSSSARPPSMVAYEDMARNSPRMKAKPPSGPGPRRSGTTVSEPRPIALLYTTMGVCLYVCFVCCLYVCFVVCLFVRMFVCTCVLFVVCLYVFCLLFVCTHVLFAVCLYVCLCSSDRFLVSCFTEVVQFSGSGGYCLRGQNAPEGW